MPHTVDSNREEYPVKWWSIVITPPGEACGSAREEADLYRRMVEEEAVDIIHLRKPDATREYSEAFLEALPAEIRSRVVLHDNFDLLDRFSLRGIHLNRRNNIPYPGAEYISASSHTLTQASAMAVTADYVTLSPVFDSISKPGYHSAFSPEDIAGQLPQNKVIALGGVTPKDFPRLRRAGFAGGALMGWYMEDDKEEKIKSAALRLRMLRAFPLLLITDSSRSEDTILQAAEAYTGGCRWVQVRMKEASTAVRAETAAKIMETFPKMLVCIDDDCEAVERSGANGVHLGKTDISTTEARRLLGKSVIIGRTANTFEDVEEIVSEGGNGVDYLGVGPFRFTTTKRNLAPQLGLEGYKSLIAKMREKGIYLPVLAIGGITIADVAELIKAGVDGIAVSGAINKSLTPVRTTASFLKELKKNL